MLEAEFHGVWVGPNGQYVDVTPKEPPVSEILFLPDNRRRYQGKPIHNVRRPLRRSDLIMEYIRVCDELDHERDKGEYHVETLRVSYPQDIHDRIQEIEEKRSRLEDLVQEELYQFLKDLRKQRGSGG
jgi:hypothetical protein